MPEIFEGGWKRGEGTITTSGLRFGAWITGLEMIGLRVRINSQGIIFFLNFFFGSVPDEETNRTDDAYCFFFPCMSSPLLRFHGSEVTEADGTVDAPRTVRTHMESSDGTACRMDASRTLMDEV
jgi:hypothetical protein